MRIDKAEKTKSILHSVISLLLTVPFLFFLVVNLTLNYPSEDSLVYEECTFEKYDYVKKKTKSSSMEYYNVFVEEYAIPLRIDNIVFNKTSKSALSDLEKGDKVTVSIEFYRDDLYYLYSMSCGDVNVLLYEDYLEAHTENDKIGTIVCSVLSCAGIGLFIAEVVYFKKHRRSLPWPRRI